MVMAKIKLTQGKFALIDKADFEWLNQWKWMFTGTYAARRNGSRREWMHRLIVGTPADKQTDHINGNKLDNRRANLRICTASQNNYNKGVQRNNKIGYKGVSIRNDRSTFRTKINNKIVGTYHTAKEAAEAYNNEAKKLHKEFAVLNDV